jgi:hypothetical protein
MSAGMGISRGQVPGVVGSHSQVLKTFCWKNVLLLPDPAVIKTLPDFVMLAWIGLTL